MRKDVFRPWKEKTKKLQEETLTDVLNREGAKDIRYEGTALRFTYAGLVVEVINQEERLVGYIHKKPPTDEEKRLLGEASSAFHSNSGERIGALVNRLMYRHFVFNGRPVQAIRDVLELAKMPPDKVG